MGAPIPDLHSALADLMAVSAPTQASEGASGETGGQAPTPDNIHVYSLARLGTGSLAMGHVSHSSHASHSSGASHYSHASHASHASHVSGSYTPYVPGNGGSASGGKSSGAVAHGQPDLLIGSAASVLRGNNIYNSIGKETVVESGSVGRKVTFQISVQNDARVSDRLRLTGSSDGSGFTVAYFTSDGTDVTSKVVNGSFRTPNLAPGASYRLKVVVNPYAASNSGYYLIGTLHAHSVRTPAKSDAVKFIAAID